MNNNYRYQSMRKNRSEQTYTIKIAHKNNERHKISSNRKNQYVPLSIKRHCLDQDERRLLLFKTRNYTNAIQFSLKNNLIYLFLCSSLFICRHSTKHKTKQQKKISRKKNTYLYITTIHELFDLEDQDLRQVLTGHFYSD
jgi:hypothetical protein